MNFERVRLQTRKERDRTRPYTQKLAAPAPVNWAGPFSAVGSQALMLQEDTQVPEAQRRILKISSSVERRVKIVKIFLAIARQTPSRLVPLELALDVGSYRLRRAGILVALSLAADLLRIPADVGRITQLVRNLLVNAERALAGGASPARVRIETRHDPASGMVCVSIADPEPRMPHAFQARTFASVFTTKGVGQGPGVGLALSNRVAHSHSGSPKYAPAEGEVPVSSTACPWRRAGSRRLGSMPRLRGPICVTLQQSKHATTSF